MVTAQAGEWPVCSAFVACSVDGFIAGPEGELDWLDTVKEAGQDYGYAAFVASVDTVLMGRRTYDASLGFGAWPHAGKECYVATHRPPPSRHGERFIAGAPEDMLALLAGAGARHVYVDGGDLIQQFIAGGLVDDVTLSIVPLLLGAGTPLFRAGGALRNLSLEALASYPTGLVQVRYRTA
jgi:dihydrofolate reductase